jgi:hypothetical protein
VSLPKPDAIVREPEARDSVAVLTEGLAEDARRAGVLPSMREIEKYAQEVTREQIARHEIAFRNGVPENKDLAAPAESAARIDQGPIDDGVGTVTKVARAYDAERHAQRRGKWVPLHVAVENACVRARLDLLLGIEDDGKGGQRERFPEWAERIRQTFMQVQAQAKFIDLDQKAQQNAATDAVLKLLDESDMTFGRDLGPWRHPKNPPRVLAALPVPGAI